MRLKINSGPKHLILVYFLNEFILQEFFVYVSKHQNCSNSGSPVIEKIEKVIYRNTSVANPGCSQILIFIHLGS
jgi:hypothetical protein